MPISVIIAVPKYVLPRAYVGGFTFVSPAVDLRFEGNVIRFNEPFTNTEWYLFVRPKFKLWSSNRYTLDYVFDADLSHADILGVPQVAGIIVSFGNVVNNGERRVIVQHTGVTTFAFELLLPEQPDGFWYPRSPDF